MRDQARQALERTLASRRVNPTPRPPKGWVRAIRDALGVSSRELAERLGVTQQAVSQLEAAERHGAVTIDRLEEAAQALGCRLDYALVPERPLGQMVHERAQRKAREILDDLWLRQLHRRMFGAIWEWAGSYRAMERNIGAGPRHIAVAVRDLVDNARVWFEDERPVRPAVRFHHRLVQAHLVDMPMHERRQRYHAALRKAVRDGDLSALEQYVQA